MLHKLLVMAHLFGACVWLGGHLFLVGAVLPRALRDRDPEPVRRFEQDFGKLGLVAITTQIVTGLWLTSIWISDWKSVLDSPTPASQLVFAKLALLFTVVSVGGYAYHRELPRMSSDRLRPFAVCALVVTALSSAMLICGAAIRFGGLF